MSKIPHLTGQPVLQVVIATFDWLAASLLARELGNTLSNTQQKNLTAEFDLPARMPNRDYCGPLKKITAGRARWNAAGAGAKADSTGKKRNAIKTHRSN